MTIDRRAVLASSVMAAAIGATDARAQASPHASRESKVVDPTARYQGPPERVVSLEEHYWARKALPDKLLKFAQTYMPQWLQDDLADVGDRRLGDMDYSGITVQVLSHTTPGGDLLDGAEGISFAKAANDLAAEAVRRNPRRFAAFAHLPMRTPEAAADELERAVSGLGFRGALINGATEGHFLDEPRFAPVLERANKLGVPIYLHPNFPTQSVVDAYYSNMPGGTGRSLSLAMFGWHAETGMHTLRLALSGTFERYPNLQLIIGHMGEMLPFMMDRIDHAWTDLGFQKGPSPTKILRERVHITTSGFFSTPALLVALTTLGADRIMFSVDYPFSSAIPARRWLDTLPVSPADRAKILHGNADRLLKLTTA